MTKALAVKRTVPAVETGRKAASFPRLTSFDAAAVIGLLAHFPQTRSAPFGSGPPDETFVKSKKCHCSWLQSAYRESSFR